ncbi:MAG: penicillin-binding transpeptidase domain-containing protein [Solirubrobacteraceae bacterium]|nr:penicillin-binding transpeptidase domain-containing protein [Solirubrobacteraceae bacterium]
MSPDRRTSTPQLALRVAAFGIIAFGVFAVLFLRLWFMQILQGDQYLAKATENPERVVRIAAPRGKIVDRSGKGVLVDNEPSTIVALEAKAVPEEDRSVILDWGQRQGRWEAAVDREVSRRLDRYRAANPKRTVTEARRRLVTERVTASMRDRRPADLDLEKDATPGLRALLSRIGPVLKTSERKLYDRVVASTVRQPISNVALKTDVSVGVRNGLLERQREYPGITVTREYLRHYPGGDLAAQIFGNVGQITEKQLKLDRYAGLQQGQRIGQDGLEFQYDDVLRGHDGQQRVEVDAQNRPTGRVREVPAEGGLRLELTLDLGLQKSAQLAMREAIGDQVDKKTNKRAGGAFVAMDPRNGEVLAMGSYPSVDLNQLNGEISARRYKRLVSERNGAPLFNRAISGGYPTGSTFKIVTAAAGLANGVITPDEVVPGGSCRYFGRNRQEFCNAGDADLGGTDLKRSIQISSDVYYYDIGAELFGRPNQPLQTWTKLFGFGRETGIDLPGERAGIIPSRAWREQRDEDEKRCRKQQKKDNCFLVAVLGEPYTLGSNINFSIGQGDFQASPLQVAVSYAGLYDTALEDNTTALTGELRFPYPHLARRVTNSKGVLERSIPARPPRRVEFDPSWKGAMLQGLLDVTATADGTAYGVFHDWDQMQFPVYGKTGTAERCQDDGCPEQSWFAAMVPHKDKPIVVVATAEAGGFGAQTAAPIVCRMLRRWYGVPRAEATCEPPATTAANQ